MSDPRARRELASVVVASVAGAAVALLAASRTWTVAIHRRPAPLPVETVARSGGSLLPWLTAVALVGLAGAGALLATRGSARRFVGALTALAGIGVTVGGAVGVTRAGGARIAWPGLVILGGLLLTACGAYATRRSAAWPAMGARYDRATPPAAPGERGEDPAATRRAAAAAPARPPTPQGTGNIAMWDALDRGVDPTDE